jgi:hypothetical protein
MFTPEQIQEAIGDRISEVEALFGEDAAIWYKVGFMECVSFMIDLNKRFVEEDNSANPELERMNQLFNKKYSTSGGIN